MAQIPSFKYDFVRFCYALRLIQIVAISINVFLIFMESGSLSYARFFFYMGLCGMYLHHVARRLGFNIDGRYDMRQLFRDPQMTARVQYAIASLSASVLCMTMWSHVQLENIHFRRSSYLCGLTSAAAAQGLLLIELYEILFVPEE